MKHILFDLDGTLIDSAPSILSCFARVLEKRGIHPKCELTHSLIGPPLAQTLEKISGVRDELLLTELANDFKSNYDEVGYKETTEYEGITDALRVLHGIGRTMYIVTNKRASPTSRIVDYLGWPDFFKGVYSLESFSPNLTSKEQLINSVMNYHGTTAKYTAYVGDRVEDLHAANVNHVRFVGVRWGYGADGFDGNIDIIETPASLVTYL